MPKGIPLTNEELNRRRHEIVASSIALFIQKGFQETSMREIADAAGMGKSSLYDYFKTKDEILLWVAEDELYDLTEASRQIVLQPSPAIERLKQAMWFHLDFLLEKKDFYLRLMFEVQRLAIESQQRIQDKRHAYQDLISNLILEGIRDGSFRPVDPLLVTRTLITMLTPSIYTSRPTGTPEEMFNAAMDIILNGIKV